MAPSRLLDVVNPFTQTVIDRVETDDAASLEVKVARAAAFYREHPLGLPLDVRVGVLERLRLLLRRDFDDLCVTAVTEGGKPLRDTRVEVERAIAGVGSALATLGAWAPTRVRLETVSGAHVEAMSERRPLGVVAALSAFNHPLNLLVHQAVPALATGCPVIVKPSEKVPRTALQLEALVREAGCPEGAWQTVVTPDVGLAQALACDRRVAFVSFIGSARVGWALRSRLPPGTRCALEHGGVAPAVLLDDVDVEVAVKKVVRGAFAHAGQVCISTKRLIVPRALRVQVLESLQGEVQRLVTGDPARDETDVGPLIRPSEAERIDAWVQGAVTKGGALVAGGKRVGPSGYLPTLVADAPLDSRLWTEEAFGPVLAVRAYDTPDEAVALASHADFAFQSAVFGRDLARCRAFASRLPGSTVMVNEHTAFRTDEMPFAGLSQSGLGVGGIPYTMHDFTYERRTVEPLG
ncbi:MAG: aldehyde dehydrogenase family protein [Myxococcaceae bacterium]|nr:aldehyde dehydrogenase family protein [Myxococcaceae bacterium]